MVSKVSENRILLTGLISLFRNQFYYEILVKELNEWSEWAMPTITC